MIASGELFVTATALDMRAELLQMCPNSGVILVSCKTAACVVHDVNATKLKQYPSLLNAQTTADDTETNSSISPSLFNRVMFNSPHFADGGSKCNNIHRQLLRELFRSAQDVLAHDGLVWVTLCAVEAVHKG